MEMKNMELYPGVQADRDFQAGSNFHKAFPSRRANLTWLEVTKHVQGLPVTVTEHEQQVHKPVIIWRNISKKVCQLPARDDLKSDWVTIYSILKRDSTTTLAKRLRAVFINNSQVESLKKNKKLYSKELAIK